MKNFPASLVSVPNNSKLAGQLASTWVLFGESSRFKLAAIHTRFDAVSWFVWDADRIDEVTGCPAVIRQEPTIEAAIQGLQ